MIAHRKARHSQLPSWICRIMAMRLAMVALPFMVIFSSWLLNPGSWLLLLLPMILTLGYIARILCNPGSQFRFFLWLTSGLILGCCILNFGIQWLPELRDQDRFFVGIVYWLFSDCLILLKCDSENKFNLSRQCWCSSHTRKYCHRVGVPNWLPRVLAIRLAILGGFLAVYWLPLLILPCSWIFLPVCFLVFLGYILRTFGNPDPAFLYFTWLMSLCGYGFWLVILSWMFMDQIDEIVDHQWMLLGLLMWVFSDSAIMLRLDLP